MELSALSTLYTSQHINVDMSNRSSILHDHFTLRQLKSSSLIGTINGHIDSGILIDVAQSQAGFNDKFLRLESGRKENPVFIGFKPLSKYPVHNVGDSGS